MHFTLDGEQKHTCLYHSKDKRVPHAEKVEQLRRIVAELESSPGPNPKVANQLVDGEPLLCWAMQHPTAEQFGLQNYYYDDLARYLIEKGANVNDTRGIRTALQISARWPAGPWVIHNSLRDRFHSTWFWDMFMFLSYGAEVGGKGTGQGLGWNRTILEDLELTRRAVYDTQLSPDYHQRTHRRELPEKDLVLRKRFAPGPFYTFICQEYLKMEQKQRRPLDPAFVHFMESKGVDAATIERMRKRTQEK